MKPLISILQDIDRDQDVRVVIRSYEWAEEAMLAVGEPLPPGAFMMGGAPGQFVVTVEVRDRKRGGAWGVIPGNLKRYSDAFEALSWATIALDNVIRERAEKIATKNLKPFQKVEE